MGVLFLLPPTVGQGTRDGGLGENLSMCGRFTQKLSWRQIHDLYGLWATGLPLNLQPRYNGAPAQDFAACRLDGDGNRAIAQLR